jgi:hypothetical protein
MALLSPDRSCKTDTYAPRTARTHSTDKRVLYTKSNFALARTLTTLMVVTCARQRVSGLLSFSLAISGGLQCGAHPHDVRILPVSLASRCLLQIKYACAMIETGTRHTILICACTNPGKVAGILRTFRLIARLRLAYPLRCRGY